MTTILPTSDTVTKQQWQLDYWFPQYPFMPGELPYSTAIVNSTLVSAEELKINRKTKIAKRIITVQLLDRAENTPSTKLISQSSILATTQSVTRDNQKRLPCV